MLKNQKVRLFAAMIVLGISITNANAFNLDKTLTSTAYNTNEWVEIKEDNGVKIYFSESQENGKSYLNIKFENVRANSIKFDWSLTKTSQIILDKSEIIEVKSSAFETRQVVINDGSLADFSITINIK